jgi:hypothetical protein
VTKLTINGIIFELVYIAEAESLILLCEIDM